MIATRNSWRPATRAALRPGIAGALTCILAALLGMVLLLSGARWVTPSTLGGSLDGAWMGRTPGWYTTSGVFEPEVSGNSGHSFSWTGQNAGWLFPRLDRSQAHYLTLRVSAGRPESGPPPPQLSLFVDGVPVGQVESSNVPQPISLEIPPRARDGASVTLVTSNIFVPGSHDRRALGVVIDDVRMAPGSGHFRPGWSVLVRLGLAVLFSVAGVLLCGLRSRLAGLAAAAVPAGFAWLLMQDAAFLGTYGDRLLAIGIGVAMIGALVALARACSPASGALPEWPVAVGLVLCASAVKLAFFTHPQIELRDAAFQVHRAELVHAGRYFFTSLTPSPGFEFPYAIGLYVTSLPFWQFFPSLLDRAALLRGLALGADALVGIALYAAARRQWNDRVAALLCAALWPFARASGMALGYANLTNVFGQGLFGVAMGLLAWIAAGPRTSKTTLVAMTGFLVAAFLSHFGTLLIGVSILGTVGAILISLGRDRRRWLGAWVLIVTTAAGAVSYGLYYAHFNALYRRTITRVVSGEDRQTTNSMVAPVALKARRWRWVSWARF